MTMNATSGTEFVAPAVNPPHYRLIFVGCLVLTIVLGAVLWFQDVKDRVFPRNFGVVEAGLLYRSGRLNMATAEDTFRDYNIKHVVSLISDGDKPEEAKPMVDAIGELGIGRTVIPMHGDGYARTAGHYANAIQAIVDAEKAGHAVLVHCNAGAQRTGGVIGTYQLLIRKQTPEQVVATMKSYGHDPHDNPDLLPWINKNLPEIAKQLKENGYIAEIPNPMPVLKP